MRTVKKRHRKRFLGAVVLALITSVTFAGDWTVVRQRDRSYVTFANVAQFYQFPEYTVSTGLLPSGASAGSSVPRRERASFRSTAFVFSRTFRS